MSGGGKSGGGGQAYTTGHRYFMGVQIVACRGPVDSVNRIIIGEREAWQGTVTTSSEIAIDKPELFGGEAREGGVKGQVGILMGGATQGRDSYLAQFQGPNCSGYRGVLSLVFKKFMWTANNPYFKSPWVEVTRIMSGWDNNDPWFPEEAKIGTYDMNPAHIIYQCLTDPAFGMGYSRSDIDDASFRAAATKLKAEGFGLSIEWSQQSTIEDFIKDVLNHINASLGVTLSTGKFAITLIRGDYDMMSLLELNESNVVEVKSFQRSAYGNATNELVVTYRDRDGETKPIAVQDIASINAQGAVISASRSYPGIRTPELAARVAMRELRTLSSPLSKVTVETNRVLWDKGVSDVVKLSWPSLGIGSVAYRIIDIDKGTHSNSKITATLVEDVFGLPTASYTTSTPSKWVDTVIPAIAADAARAIEAPFWEIARRLRLADQEKLEPDYGFGMVLASRGSVRSTLNFVLSASADNITYSDVTTGSFCPVGRLTSGISYTAESLTLSGAYDLDSVVIGTYAYIENECVEVVACNAESGAVSIKRGVLDTVPTPHAANALMLFVGSGAAFDNIERTEGEVVYYKPRPATGLGALALDDADVETLTFANRASRPYPPGNVRIGGVHYPVSIVGPDVTVEWSHRDRIAQTVDLNDYLTGNIGPEPGTTYRLRLYSGATLLRTYEIAGDTTTWTYPSADSTADGSLSVLRITLHSVRDGLESLYAIDHAFQRSVVSGSIGIGGTPGAPTLSAVGVNFGNELSWTFNGAEVVERVEVRVSETPDFNHSALLQYVDFPGASLTHELGTALTYRWYWVRAIGVTGLMSPWSNMASARSTATAKTPAEMLAEINTLLSAPGGPDSIEMQADRFVIKSPDGEKVPFAVVDIGGGVYKTLLNSDVLIGGSVDIANLRSGSLPTDVMMRLGGGTIELDGAGEIRVYKSLAPNADFVKLSAGEIRFLRNIGGVYQTYNYLSRLEVGIANSGDEVIIPGYWKAQPRVMVSPATLQLFKASDSNQDQSVSCRVLNLTEVVVGSGRWKFDPVATLTLAARVGNTVLSESSGVVSTNAWTSAQKTTIANCISITPSVSFLSARGNGSGPNLYRSVRWRVEYFHNGWWQSGAYRIVNIGPQLSNHVSDSFEFSFPSAGAWQWRIYAEAYDTDSTTFGSVSYTYSQTTCYPPGGSYTASVNGSSTTASLSVPFTVTGSGEIYEIVYNYSLAWSMNWSVTTDTIAGRCIDASGTLTKNFSYPSNLSQSYSRSQTVTGSNLSVSNRTFSLSRTGGNNTYTGINLSITGASALVKRRTIIPNSTTPSNTFNVNSYGFNLTSAQVLASGTLNWLAVGE